MRTTSRTLSPSAVRASLPCLALTFALATTTALAQGTVSTPSATPARAGAAPIGGALAPAIDAWSGAASVTPLVTFDADLDRGGDYGTAGVLVRAGASTPVGNGFRVGLTFAYDYLDYDFDAPVAFGGVAPWGTVQRIGFSVPLSWTGEDGWFAGLTPSIDWFRENGADWSESASYGALLFGGRSFAPNRRIGLGVAVFRRFDDTDVFPFLSVDWPLGDRWRITNPLAAGPTGPAGLEIRYDLGDGWEIGAGAAYRSLKFRLASDGRVPNGIGEERGVATFVHANRRFGGGLELSIYAGAVLGGELRLDNSSNQSVVREDFDPAPLLAITLSGRF